MPVVDPRCRLLVRGPFRPGEVAVTLRSERRPTTPALDRRIDATWASELARAARDGRHLFNGPILRLVESRVQTTAAGSRLELFAAPATYMEFVGTNLDPECRPDFAGGPWPWAHFANALGTSAVVVTRDGQLVAGRRSDRVLGNPGCVHAFGGILEAADRRGAQVDVFASLRRELHEELGVTADEVGDAVLEGMILEPEIHQPELIFHVSVALPLAELTHRWQRAESRDEHAALVTLARAPPDPEAELARVAPVSPIGRAALALYWSARS